MPAPEFFNYATSFGREDCNTLSKLKNFDRELDPISHCYSGRYANCDLFIRVENTIQLQMTTSHYMIRQTFSASVFDRFTKDFFNGELNRMYAKIGELIEKERINNENISNKCIPRNGEEYHIQRILREGC